MGNIVDLGPRNPCNSIRCEKIAQGISIDRRFVLSYIYIPFAVPEPFVGIKVLLWKVTLEIEGFRVGPFPPNPSLIHRFRTSKWLLPLDFTKIYYDYRYITGRQTQI